MVGRHSTQPTTAVVNWYARKRQLGLPDFASCSTEFWKVLIEVLWNILQIFISTFSISFLANVFTTLRKRLRKAKKKQVPDRTLRHNVTILLFPLINWLAHTNNSLTSQDFAQKTENHYSYSVKRRKQLCFDCCLLSTLTIITIMLVFVYIIANHTQTLT